MSKKTIYIMLFAILYICVGLVSTIHAVAFFGLANSPVLGTILAITFEIGQAAVLFNLLTSPDQRKKFMPWALMCILTLVQILGNIFSSYKYIVTNSPENLRYFKEPIFIWTDIPDDMATVIVTYIVGAILPVVALCLTEMVTSYLYSEEPNQETPEKMHETLKEEIIVENKPEKIEEQHDIASETVIDNEIDNVVEIKSEENNQADKELVKETIVPKVEEVSQQEIEETVPEKKEVISKEVEEIFNKNNKSSHFINM